MGKITAKRPVLVLLTLALSFGSGVVWSAPWDFSIETDLGILYTDNVFLADSGLEQSETAFNIAPEFILTKDSQRLQADLRYRPEAYFYSDNSDSNDIYNILDASLVGALVRERLFLALSASSYQSIISPDGRFPTTNLPISQNRVDSTTLAVRPYWQQRIGPANLLAEVDYRRVDYGGSDFQSSEDKEGHLRVDNIESQQGLAWAVDYMYRRMEYDVSLPFEYQRASLNLGFWVSSALRVFAEGGAETSFDNFYDADMDSDFWEAGFQYKPNQRLDLELAAGDRSFGATYRGRLAYTLRRGSLTATYTESPSTRADEAFDRRPILGTDNLDGLLDRPGESDRYIRRRGEIRLNIELAKSDLTLRAFSEKHDRRTTADGTPLQDEEFSGAAIRWSWNIGTKTTLGLGTDISERDETTRKDDLLRTSVDLVYQLSARLRLRAEAIHSDQDGKQSSSFNYDENQVRLYLSSEF